MLGATFTCGHPQSWAVLVFAGRRKPGSCRDSADHTCPVPVPSAQATVSSYSWLSDSTLTAYTGSSENSMGSGPERSPTPSSLSQGRAAINTLVLLLHASLKTTCFHTAAGGILTQHKPLHPPLLTTFSGIFSSRVGAEAPMRGRWSVRM